MPVPLLVALGLKGFLISIVTGLIFRALFAIGFSYVTVTGVVSLMDNVQGYVKSLFSAVPSEVGMILGLAKMDVALNIVFGAMIARLILVGMDKVTGTLTSMALYNRYTGG